MEEVIEFKYRKPPAVYHDLLRQLSKSCVSLRRQTIVAMKVLKREGHSQEKIVQLMKEYFGVSVTFENYPDGTCWTVC